jgi:hypothetical protein
MVLHYRLTSEGRQRRIYTKRASGPPKTIMEKKKKKRKKRKLSRLSVM